MNLSALLERCAHYDGEYGDHLSNHLPMALIALSRLGVSDSELENFFSFYSPRLRPKAFSEIILNASNWQKYLGLHSHHASYVRFFNEEIELRGRDEVLSMYIPKLIPGLAGAAFHGVIRTAYGVDGDCISEICEGLAHWAVTYLPLVSIDFNERAPVEPYESLKNIALDYAWETLVIKTPTIFEAMAQIASMQLFQDSLTPLPKNTDLRALASIAVDAYAASASFTALHLVTASHALRVLLPFCKDESQVLEHFWIAFKAAYLVFGRPQLQPMIRETFLPEWDALRRSGIASNNDHTIKLLYTCSVEESTYFDPRYRKIAAIRVGF